MSLTDAQREAIAARGNVLVMAGAGTGKTSTLVERCLSCLIDEKPPVSLDEILMVTFTDAAAAEMRRRIRARMETMAEEAGNKSRWLEQLALFDAAHIGTLHGFCLKLLRQHFYDCRLDPQVAVMAEEEARLMADETLDAILAGHYSGDTEFAAAVQQLVQSHGRGWDLPVRTLVLRLHHYTQTLRNPEAWMSAQLEMFQSEKPAQWQEWILEGAADWRNQWLPILEITAKSNPEPKLAECLRALRILPVAPSRQNCAETLAAVCEVARSGERGKKNAWRKGLDDFFEDAQFLYSLARVDKPVDPLQEDWNWLRGQIGALLNLAREFSAKFSEAKRELGLVDFHDLEQHALELLWDRSSGRPTATAELWREKLRFVFVDEYQDINEAQDAILQALSREGAAANRFLVGDVKQSIYRFRLADSRIFQGYAAVWRGKSGQTVPLVENFRSRPPILNFVNAVFGSLMRRGLGEMDYDEEARLQFGDAEHRAALGTGRDSIRRVELCLRLKGTGDNSEESTAALESNSLDESGKDARMVAMRLKQLKESAHPIWDKEQNCERPVDWRDMAVLLRSPAGRAESYAREFARLGVPLEVARSGFYDSSEVEDLLSLLQLLDNPLQDLPAIAVMRSPLAGLKVDELARVRLADIQGHFWRALQRYYELGKDVEGCAKVGRFMKNFGVWRRLVRQVSLSRCLETVLDATHYADWLLTLPRGQQRQAKVRRLLELARQFDRFQHQGLYRFLNFVKAQQEADLGPEVAAVSGENAVALLSIHQSKGLEFPVVVVADLGKAFNFADLNAEIILDSRFGICPQVQPPRNGQRYPSLPWWLARKRQRKEMLSEELRLLYVAMTRARDTLILSGATTAKNFAGQLGAVATGLETASLLGARCAMHWVLAWAAAAHAFEPANPDASPPTEILPDFIAAPAGENQFWKWMISAEVDLPVAESAPAAVETSGIGDLQPAALEKLRERLAWRYPNDATVHLPAKTSVTTIRRKWADEEFEAEARGSRIKRQVKGGKAGAEIGLAHHTFLQFVNLAQLGSEEELRLESRRMLDARILDPDEVAELNFVALAAFWKSPLGREIREHAGQVQRELPFTARFSPAELRLAGVGQFPAEEFIVVQGFADLAVLLPAEIWLLDFKTDSVGVAEIPARADIYRPQIILYALALERIYRRPVTRAAFYFLAAGKQVDVRREEISPAVARQSG